MGNLMLMIFCLFAGAMLSRSGRLPSEAPQVLNGIAIYFVLPALAMRYLHQLLLMPGSALTALMPRAIFAACILLCILIGRRCGLSPAVVTALALAGRLGNTDFAEITATAALQPQSESLLLAMPVRPASYLALSTFGMLAITLDTIERSAIRSVAAKICLSPPLMAFCAMLFLIDAIYPSWFAMTPQRLGDLGIPLTALSVGFSLGAHGLGLGVARRVKAACLQYTLTASPMHIITACLLSGLPAGAPVRHALLLRSALAPWPVAGMFARQRRMESEILALLLGIGIPLLLLAATLIVHGICSMTTHPAGLNLPDGALASAS